MLIFRKAEKGDLGRLVELMDQLGYQVDVKTLAESLKHYKQSVLVVIDEGCIIGCLAFHILLQFHSAHRHLRVVSFVIDDSHRRKGIGKDLLTKAEEIAKENGCLYVELTSGVHRAKEGVHDFYSDQGYRNDESVYFRKKLS